MPSWGDLGGANKPAPEPADNELERLCWLVLGSGSGAKLLELLHKAHVERRFNPQAEERALRVFAAEAQLVLRLVELTARGKASAERRKPKAG